MINSIIFWLYHRSAYTAMFEGPISFSDASIFVLVKILEFIDNLLQLGEKKNECN